MRDRWHKAPPPEQVLVWVEEPHELTMDECIPFVLGSSKNTYRMLRAIEDRLTWGRWEGSEWDRVRRYFPEAAEQGHERARLRSR